MQEHESQTLTRRLLVLVALACVAALGVVFSRHAVARQLLYLQWEHAQVAILERNASSMNGLLPAPEDNPYFELLVREGTEILPALAARLERECGTTYRGTGGHRASLGRYIAFAMMDICGWSQTEMEPRPGERGSIQDRVLERYREVGPAKLKRAAHSDSQPPIGLEGRAWRLD